MSDAGWDTANGSIVTCDGTHTSTPSTRYVRSSFSNTYLIGLSEDWRRPPSRVYCGLCNLCPDPVMALQFSVHAVSFQRAQDGASWKGT